MRGTAQIRWICGALILSCALLSAGCSTIEKWVLGARWEMPRVVQLKGVESSCIYLPTWCSIASADRPAGVLARDGDLISFKSDKKEHVFFYRGTDGESLVLDVQGDVVLLNGKAVSLGLSEKGTEWLRKASTEDLAGLRLLQFGERAKALEFPLLEKLARVRPDIALLLHKIDQPDIVARLLSLFEPHFLSIDLKVLSTRFDVLEPQLAKLKILWTDGEGSLDFLPRLPRLRTLWLSDWARAGSGAIPGGIRNLRSVTLWGGKGVQDLSLVKNVTGLQELVVWGKEDDLNLKDISALAAFPDLRKLVFALHEPKNVLDLSVLERLPKLAWLGFPGNTTQEAFAKVIASHPDLKLVELRSENVRDLSPLRRLRSLKALTLWQVKVDVGALQDLKSLRYLALPDDAFKGDAAKNTAALEKALPETFVAQAAPYCLGSGWILLLLPAIVLLRRLWSRGHGQRSMAGA